MNLDRKSFVFIRKAGPSKSDPHLNDPVSYIYKSSKSFSNVFKCTFIPVDKKFSTVIVSLFRCLTSFYKRYIHKYSLIRLLRMFSYCFSVLSLTLSSSNEVGSSNLGQTRCITLGNRIFFSCVKFS